MTGRRRLCAVVGGLAALALTLAPGAAAATPVSPAADMIGVTGPGPLNFTDVRWNVGGTDLGSMFEWRGRVYMTFGDTFGAPHPEGNGSNDWRSNTMAYFADADPEVGPVFNGMITEPGSPLRAKELLSSAKQDCTGATGFCENSVIPNSGFAVGDRMYLHFMSVRRFNYPEPGDYDTNYSGLAWSDDGGQTWTKSSSVVWPADAKGANFGIAAAVKRGGYVYLLGIPAGGTGVETPHSRRGSAKLARVKNRHVLKQSAYRYWNGSGWSPRQARAAVVADGPVGEPSVQWNSYIGKWVMMYLRVKPDTALAGHIVLRTAACLTGPWSAPRNVLSSDEIPLIYAPMIPPRWNDGPKVYFGLSIFSRYNVFWFRTELTDPRRPGRTPCVTR